MFPSLRPVLLLLVRGPDKGNGRGVGWSQTPKGPDYPSPTSLFSHGPRRDRGVQCRVLTPEGGTVVLLPLDSPVRIPPFSCTLLDLTETPPTLTTILPLSRVPIGGEVAYREERDSARTC